MTSIVLSITILIGCKPTAKRQESTDKRINVINNLNAPLPKDPFDKERLRIAGEWLDDLQSVTQKSGIRAAQNIAEFIRANGVISKPYQDGLVTLGFSQGITREHFRIVPVVQSDNTNPTVKYYVPEGVGGRYSSDLRVMWLREEKTSSLFRGLTILHEGAHVMQTGPQYKTGEEGWCNAEYDAFGVQARVLNAIGGKRYAAILFSQANAMLANYRKSKGMISFPEYDSRYDAVFGKPISMSEIQKRRTIFGIHTVYTMLNGISSGPGKDAFVVRGVCEMYKNIGGERMKEFHGK